MTPILVSGIAVLDFVFFIDAMPTRSEKYRANDAQIVGGGCAASASLAINRLGGRASLIAQFGDDAVADLTIANLQKDAVDCSLCARHPDGRSSFSSIYVDHAGERQVVNYRDPSMHTDLSDLSTRLTGTYSAVLADSRWPYAANQLMLLARTLGIPGVMDLESPDDDLDTAIQTASHIALSAEGLRDRTGEQDLKTGLQRMRLLTEAWLCVTNGPDDVLVMAKDDIQLVAPYSISAVDTLGAGDIWHGAFALRLAETRDELTAIQFANAVAAIKCMRPGGGDGTPTRDEVTAFMASH